MQLQAASKGESGQIRTIFGLIYVTRVTPGDGMKETEVTKTEDTEAAKPGSH